MEWKPVVGFEGRYEASDAGQIRSAYLNRNLRPWSAKGYLLVRLYDGSRPKKPHDYLVHRLVAAAFIGPDDREINHKNGIKGDNAVSNLEYCTRSENLLHAFRVLKIDRPHGQSHHSAKLNNESVSQIKRMLSEGRLPRLIADQFGVNTMSIYRIQRGKAWSHVPDQQVTVTELG